jgi:hypothetical protein
MEAAGIVAMAVCVTLVHSSLTRADYDGCYRFQVYVLQTFFTKTGRRYKV